MNILHVHYTWSLPTPAIIYHSQQCISMWLLHFIITSEGRSMQKVCVCVRGLKYAAPNINAYVIMIFTAFSLKSGKVLATLALRILLPMITYG